jgi:aspartyl-tRNA(Asn)/glutamyl-tRNA(Gln) amidotransferase subunit C
MSQLKAEEVKKIAKLASLDLDEAEINLFTKQLSEVIDYNVEKLSKVDTEKTEPLLNVSGLTNVYREDRPEPGLSQKEVLQNAKDKHNGFFKVKQILDQS